MGSLLHCRCLGVLSLPVSIILLLIFPWLQKSAQVRVVYAPVYGDGHDDVLQMWAWRSIRETDRLVMQLDEHQGNLFRLIVPIGMYWQLVSSGASVTHEASQRTNKRLALQKTQGRRMPKVKGHCDFRHPN